MQPHRSQCWLSPKIENIEVFQEQVKTVCDLYLKIEELTEEGTLVYSTDEKMGIQAKEHANKKQNMKPSQVERIDPEYIRHGTTGLIASRNIATGEITAPLVQPTRKEGDYLHHIQSVVGLNPEAKQIFIQDNLNTHVSESLVRYIAEIEGIDPTTLGKKGTSGILKNMKSRAEFLSDKSHQIIFVYTPKHCSWLNQIECWFSIITRRLLNKRSSFTSISDLEQKIREFIAFYNKHLMKPFKWNFSGKFLKFTA